MRRALIALAFVIVFAGLASAASPPWSGIIDSPRAADWASAGVTGGISTRTAICQTLSPGVTAAQIRTAMINCPAGQVVFLNAGTYNIGGIDLDVDTTNNNTLRGAGPNQTILKFTGTEGCSGPQAGLCVGGQWIDVSGTPQGSANWTAGYTVGTTVITLSNVTGLQVGDQIILDQTNSSSDTGEVFINCSTSFTDEGGCSPAENRGRAQNHHAIVQAINGNQVTIDPPIRMPNWSGGSPQAIWSAQRPRTGIGIENLTVDASSLGNDSSGILFMGAVNSWVKNVRVNDPDRAHIRFYQSSRITVQDSLLYGGRRTHSTSYGFEVYGASDLLLQNNIIEKRTSPFSLSGPGSGTVIAYNYARNQPWDSPTNYQPGTVLWHEAGISHYLLEGNDFPTVWHDDIHGTTHFHTMFRNLIEGDAAKAANTSIIQLNSYGRYFNIVGNVLGRGTYYTTYEASGSTGGGDLFIYSLGQSPGAGVPNDALVKSTMFRWGNYDTVNNANRFLASEVPSGISPYPNSVPGSQTLPFSFYLSAKPAWFGSIPWPAIGPEVTGGNISGYGGRAYKIPARVCWESLSQTNGSDFNADTCYPAGGANAPRAPTGVRIVP